MSALRDVDEAIDQEALVDGIGAADVRSGGNRMGINNELLND